MSCVLQKPLQKQAEVGILLEITPLLGFLPFPFLPPTIPYWPPQGTLSPSIACLECLAKGLLWGEQDLRCISQPLESPAVCKPLDHSASELAL